MYQLVIGNKVYSSWSLRPWVLMKTLGIDFEEINIPLYTAAGKKQLLQYHEAGKVPLLINSHTQQTVWDSMAIFETLFEAHPDKNLWPSEPLLRNHARCIANEMHSSFNEIRNQLPMNCRADKTFAPINEPLQEVIDRVTSIWQQCREQYAHKGEFLFGSFSIADAMFAPVVLRFNSYHIPVNDSSKAYMQTILNLPAIQDWITTGKNDPTRVESYEI